MDISNLIDRRSKMKPDAWDAYALSLASPKNNLEALKDTLNNFDLWRKNESLVRLFSALEALGVREYVKFDPNIVRVFCITPERSSRLMKPAAP